MYKALFLSTILSIITLTSVFAQPQPGMKFNLHGTILDSQNNKPVMYANVVLYSQRDSSMVDGTITGEDGGFEIEAKRPGKYYMVVQFIGYERYTLQGITISPQSPTITLKPITINPSAITLQEAVVTDRRNEIIYKIDRKVVQVAGNANVVGTTAVEVLENTPGFEVDDEGNVTLRGSDNFTVLINGKPTVLTGNDALKQIPASSIENIEVITNPSARYEPDGLTGIINVTLKKDTKSGLNGLLDVSAGNSGWIGMIDRYNVSANLNYRNKGHSLTFGYDLHRSSRSGLRGGERKTFINTDTITRIEKGERLSDNIGNTFRLGYEVDLTKKSSLSINGLIRIGGDESESKNKQTISHSSPDSTINLITNNKSNGKRDNYDVNSTFLHKFDNEGHELQIMGSLSGNKFNNFGYNDEFVDNIKTIEWQDSSWTAEQAQTIQLDYSKPFTFSKFETGAKSRFRQIDFENTNYNNPYMLSNSVNHLLYDDQIHAVYIMGSSKIERWEFQLGLRTEYYRINLHQESDGSKSVKEDINFFPTIHLSNSTGNNKFMAGYSRRVNRPFIFFLNPYESFSDAYNVRRGNPNLDPEFSHALEINYLRYFGQSTASATLFYRQTDNAISRVRYLYDPVNNPGLMLNTFENMNKNSSLGIEASVRHSFTKWLQFDGNYSFFHYKIEGFTNNMPVNTSSMNHTFRANLTFRVSKNGTLTANAMYFSPSVSPQGTRGAFYNNGLSYRHHILDRKGTISISMRNPFGKFRWEFTSEGPNFYDYSYRQPNMPRITIGFSYKLNEGVKRQRTNGEKTEDFSDDMEM